MSVSNIFVPNDLLPPYFNNIHLNKITQDDSQTHLLALNSNNQLNYIVGVEGTGGVQGVQGGQGAQGFRGSQGTQGLSGGAGSQGSQGINGGDELVIARYSLSADQNTSSDIWTTIVYDTINTSSPYIIQESGLFTINLAGIYSFTSCIYFTSNGSGVRSVNFNKNGSTAFLNNNTENADSISYNAIQSTYTDYFNIGDVLNMETYQNSGSVLPIFGSVLHSTGYSNLIITGII